MEKENTSTMSKRKKIVYSVILAVCVLLLVAATVLTVYFVTDSNDPVLDNQGQVDPNDPAGPSGSEDPNEPAGPSGSEDPNEPAGPGGSEDPNDPAGPGGSEPSGGAGRVAYIAPIEGAACTVEYYEIYNNTTLDNWTRHMAMDFGADEGAEVRAMGDGTVVKISLSAELGNLIEIEHANGVTSIYRFVEPVETLKVGDKVKQGDKIAAVAAAYGTEEKDGTHLHLEMKSDGKYVDPTDYIDATLTEK